MITGNESELAVYLKTVVLSSFSSLSLPSSTSVWLWPPVNNMHPCGSGLRANVIIVAIVIIVVFVAAVSGGDDDDDLDP